MKDGPARTFGPRHPVMPTTHAPLQEHLLLTGFYPLLEYLHWRSLMAPAEEPDLLAAWRRCSVAAAGIEVQSVRAEDIRIEPLPGHLQARADRLLNATAVPCGAAAQTDVALVELNSLAVFQRHVNLVWASELRQRWQGLTGEAERLDFCLSTATPDVPVAEARLSPDTFAFTSPSQDLRVQKILSLTPAHLQGWTPPGPAVAFVGAAVGFGSNCLRAIRWGQRLILVNGTHRAYALRQAGETMVPCLILNVNSEEELAIVAPELLEYEAKLLTATRPPLVQDLFHPHLTERLLLPRRIRQVRVTISVEEIDLPG